MGNKPAGYWILLLLAIAALVASFMMRSSPDPHTRDISRYLWMGSIAMLLIARLFFRGKTTQPTPPMPRD
jgi:predicted membrane channel-forming protein YqfA (hemolysin III family)